MCLFVCVCVCLFVFVFVCVCVSGCGCGCCFLSSSLTRDARRARGVDTSDQLAWQNTSCTLHGALKAPTFTVPSARLCRTPDVSKHSPAARCSLSSHSPQERDRSPKNSGLSSVDFRRALFGLASPPCGWQESLHFATARLRYRELPSQSVSLFPTLPDTLATKPVVRERVQETNSSGTCCPLHGTSQGIDED